MSRETLKQKKTIFNWFIQLVIMTLTDEEVGLEVLVPMNSLVLSER